MTSERFWGLVLGNLGVFDGVPAGLQMVLDGGNGRNGRYNGWIPLALGLLLFTDPIVVLLFMFNTKNTVHRPTLPCSTQYIQPRCSHADQSTVCGPTRYTHRAIVGVHCRCTLYNTTV